jgi:8-hydroxy-5-deazaflavin:NADPH oxidoreductase
MTATTYGTTPLEVAVIGTGNIGGTLGRKFAAAGHRVTFGSRHPAEADGIAVTDVATALDGAAVVVLALPGPAAKPFAEEHATALADRLVVDATNSIGGGGPAHSRAAITAAAPTARYARAFNTLGWENFADPVFGDETADLFFSAAEVDRGTVETLITAVGLRPVYVGDGQEDVVDGLLRLWFALAAGQGHGRHLAFRLLEDPR